MTRWIGFVDEFQLKDDLGRRVRFCRGAVIGPLDEITFGELRRKAGSAVVDLSARLTSQAVAQAYGTEIVEAVSSVAYLPCPGPCRGVRAEPEALTVCPRCGGSGLVFRAHRLAPRGGAGVPWTR